MSRLPRFLFLFLFRKRENGRAGGPSISAAKLPVAGLRRPAATVVENIYHCFTAFIAGNCRLRRRWQQHPQVLWHCLEAVATAAFPLGDLPTDSIVLRQLLYQVILQYRQFHRPYLWQHLFQNRALLIRHVKNPPYLRFCQTISKPSASSSNTAPHGLLPSAGSLTGIYESCG